MNRKLTTILLLTLACLSMDARKTDGKPAFELKRHEISVSGGYLPGMWFAGYGYDYPGEIGRYWGRDHYPSLEKTHINASIYEIEKCSLAWTFNYFYNFNRFIAIGPSLTYTNGSSSFYRRNDDSHVTTEKAHFITAMANFRFSWLNRPYIRMYSLAGVGKAFSLNGMDMDGYTAFQLSPVCISVGKDIFGFAEVGFGINYAGGNIGIGYRF